MFCLTENRQKEGINIVSERSTLPLSHGIALLLSDVNVAVHYVPCPEHRLGKEHRKTQLRKCCLWWTETWNSLSWSGLKWAALPLTLEPGVAWVARWLLLFEHVLSLHLLKPEISAGYAKQAEITFLYGVLAFLSSNQSVQATVIFPFTTHMQFTSSLRSRCCHPYKDLVIR